MNYIFINATNLNQCFYLFTNPSDLDLIMLKSINFLLTLFLLLTFNNVVAQCSKVDEFDELLALDDELE
ncbi:transmembrane protein, putative [Medicago truncatula]|uniref:Transmembrane protein, putative n=1 Tax=Medicago truncatula TaxID=3880 RepID=G7JRN0_MEDTR|nr:transmembrane protein, putative [Medicago truncatula]